VDDSEDLRVLALTAFADEQMDIYSIERGTVDLDLLAAWRPSVIVLDPEGGPDATRKPFDVVIAIHDDPRFADVPIVLAAAPSTLWQYEPEVQYVEPSATIPKPYSVDELVAVVRDLMRQERGPTLASEE
jgi:DNA-binding response OmpR family regulator